MNLKFEEYLIISSTIICESKYTPTSFHNIVEIKDYLILITKTNDNIIIPKANIDVESLRTELKSVAEKYQIEFISELDWKW